MSSSTRIKQERNLVVDVNFARNKLDGVLQALMEKAEDSTEQSDEEGLAPDVIVKDLPSSSVAPSKRGFSGRIPRKRRRKDDNNGRDVTNGNFSYVMKLFDRSVDLAKFNEETPLYPICRAWMYNEPYNGNLKAREPSPVPEEDQEAGAEGEEQDEGKRNVYSLPAPLKFPKQEPGARRNKDAGIPSPLDPLNKKLDIHADQTNAPAKEELLSANLTKWKAVKQKFKEASHANEIRYKESLSIIKSLKVVYE